MFEKMKICRKSRKNGRINTNDEYNLVHVYETDQAVGAGSVINPKIKPGFRLWAEPTRD